MHNTWTSIIGDESVQERRPSRRRILYRRPLQERRMRCAPAASLPGPSIRPVDVESGSPDGTRIDRERKGGHRSAALRGTLSPKGGWADGALGSRLRAGNWAGAAALQISTPARRVGSPAAAQCRAIRRGRK
jgi:hypothetical protein